MEHNHKEQDLELSELSKITDNPKEKAHADNDGHDHEALAGGIGKNKDGWESHWDLLLALVILIILLVLEFGFKIELPFAIALGINLIAYFLAGRKVLDLA